MSYHLRRSEIEIKDKNELQAIIEKGKYGILGLCSDNEPYVITLYYTYDKDGQVLYFHCAQEGLKIDFIWANPSVCMTIIEDYRFDSGESAYKSLIIRGQISIVTDNDEIDRVIQLQIDQLETKNPETVLTRLLKENNGYANLQILKLQIKEISGKAGQ